MTDRGFISRLLPEPPAPRLARLDREARNELQRLIRQLCSRQITNFQFEERAAKVEASSVDDPAIPEAIECASHIYDDFREHRVGPLSREGRLWLARLILFLRSDEPYCWAEWPKAMALISWRTSVVDVLSHLLFGGWLPIGGILNAAIWYFLRMQPRYIAPHAPDHLRRDEIWPFQNRETLAHSRRQLLVFAR